MPKYTKEFKIKLILEYLSGEIGGIRKVADKYNIPKSTLELWINTNQEDLITYPKS